MNSKLFSKVKKIKKNVEPQGFTIIDDSTPFAIREAFKSLYTNILYLNTPDKCKKIAITSAVPGEGKTTVATNLAITIAANSENKRVLLVDTDMRQPKVARLLSLDIRGKGLSEYLAGIDEKPYLNYIPKLNITVLTSGGPNANPSMLVGSSKMAELVRLCEQQFDYIIFDTPPVNVVTDALLLNEVVNGYVVSTMSDYSNVNHVAECVESLERIGAEIYGVVLSSLKIKAGSSGYSKYNSKYSKYAK
ncbi:MAG: CpsD/CapB family tyrosine-protein kinase [Clostridia bacterium]|nr:CpsD/CapB family tyrosine-protein kinase [Clostridia bacterium]